MGILAFLNEDSGNILSKKKIIRIDKKDYELDSFNKIGLLEVSNDVHRVIIYSRVFDITKYFSDEIDFSNGEFYLIRMRKVSLGKYKITLTNIDKLDDFVMDYNYRNRLLIDSVHNKVFVIKDLSNISFKYTVFSAKVDKNIENTVLVDKKNKSIHVLNNIDSSAPVTVSKIALDSILKYVIKEDVSTTAHSVTTGGASVSRAIVGDLLAGSAGAIIGGTTGKRTTNTSFDVRKKYMVKITVNNLEKPYIIIDCKNEKMANDIVASLDILSMNNKKKK